MNSQSSKYIIHHWITQVLNFHGLARIAVNSLYANVLYDISVACSYFLIKVF